MATSMNRLFDSLPVGEWVCWDRPPVMYVCYDSDGCSYYPMDTGFEARGPFPLFSWEYAMATDGRGGFYVTGGHDENRQVRVQDPYSVGHEPPFPDSFFGPMVSELWRYDVRDNRWTEVDQEAWGPRQCVAARHMVRDADRDVLVRTAACREGHSPRPPVPLRGWGTFGVWTYDIEQRRWTWMQPSERLGPLTYDTNRRVVLGYRNGRVGVYDTHANEVSLRAKRRTAPAGEGAFVYDRAHDLCLFHGESGETWTYDIDADAWTNRAPTPSPPARPRFGFALDPDTGTAILFGGRGRNRHRDDTWLYSVEENRWRRVRGTMKPEGRFWWGRGILFDEVNRAFVLYGGLAIYKRVKARFAVGDVWVFRLPPLERPRRRPPAAPVVRLTTTKRSVEIDWEPVRGAAGYFIERGEGAPGAVTYRPLTDAPAEASGCTDETGAHGTRYHYRVQAVRANGDQGPWSAPVRTDPPVPTGLVVSVLKTKRVEVSWDAAPGQDVVGYRVRRVRVMGEDRYAAETVIDAGRRTTHRETPAGLPKRHYQYQVQAVSRFGVASGWSAPAGTIPSAPAALRMTPDADRRTIALRWPANPEKGIVGYNLYRWVEPPFRFAFKEEPELITPAWWTFDEGVNPAQRMQWVKVNDEPVAGTRYVDRGLKLVTTWYYVRAVNALGVEGHYRTSYSMPVWRWHADARKFF